MVRTAFVAVAALSSSANAFFAPVPGYTLARTSRASAPIQMVTSPGITTTPAIFSWLEEDSMNEGEKGEAIVMESKAKEFTATLKKLEAESIADLQKAFDETAIKAKAESEKIWGDLEAEFAGDEGDEDA